MCDENFALLDSYWVKRDNNIEAVAHYKYFKARQYHDKAYIASGEDKEKGTSSAFKLFEEALRISNENLNPAHPVRLRILESFSVFQCDMLDSVDKALAIAKEAYEKGKCCLSELSEELKYYAEIFLEHLSEKIDNWS